MTLFFLLEEHSFDDGGGSTLLLVFPMLLVNTLAGLKCLFHEVHEAVSSCHTACHGECTSP